MSWELVPMQPGHVRRFLEESESAEREVSIEMLEPGMADLLASHHSWALLDPDGGPQALGGTIEQWRGRHTAWLFVNGAAKVPALRLVRAIRTGLASVRGRIEATVRADFEQGHKLARAVGFEIENPPGLLRQFGPEGEDHIMYVRQQ